MGVRDYDPKLSQFLTPDPLYLEDLERCQASPLRCSLYGYASGNPISFVDPTGMDHVAPDQIRQTFMSWMNAWSNVYAEAQRALDSHEADLRRNHVHGDAWVADGLDRIRLGQTDALGPQYEAIYTRLSVADAQLQVSPNMLNWLEAQGAMGRSPTFEQITIRAAEEARWQALYVNIAMTALTAGYSAFSRAVPRTTAPQ